MEVVGNAANMFATRRLLCSPYNAPTSAWLTHCWIAARMRQPSCLLAIAAPVLALCVKFAYSDKRQHDEWIRLATRLLDQGADPTSALWPALHAFGAIVKRADLIRLLLDRGANVDQQMGNSGNTVRELVEVNKRRYTDEILHLFNLPCRLNRA